MTSYRTPPKDRDRVLRAFENNQAGPRRLPSAPKPQRSNPGFGNWRSSIIGGQTPNRRKRGRKSAPLLP